MVMGHRGEFFCNALPLRAFPVNPVLQFQKTFAESCGGLCRERIPLGHLGELYKDRSQHFKKI